MPIHHPFSPVSPSLSLQVSLNLSLPLSVQTELGNEADCHWLKTYHRLNTVFKGFTNIFSQTPPSWQPARQV